MGKSNKQVIYVYLQTKSNYPFYITIFIIIFLFKKKLNLFFILTKAFVLKYKSNAIANRKFQKVTFIQIEFILDFR